MSQVKPYIHYTYNNTLARKRLRQILPCICGQRIQVGCHLVIGQLCALSGFHSQDAMVK